MADNQTTDSFAALREIVTGGIREFQVGEPIRHAAALALAEIERLRWLPKRDDDIGEWSGGWNRCLDRIRGHRAGKEYIDD